LLSWQPNGPLHPQAVNTSLTNDPHLEKVGNNYKKVDPFTLGYQARPSQPLGKRPSPRTCWVRYTAKSSYLGMLQRKPDKFPKCDRAKYLGLLRSSPNQYSLQNLLILRAGDRQNRASPNLTNPLRAKAGRVCQIL